MNRLALGMCGLACLAFLVQVDLAHDLSGHEAGENPGKVRNSIGIEFVTIPAGKFLMGSSEVEKGRDQDETQHEVTLPHGFQMGVYEVTQAQYEQVMGKNPSIFKGASLPVELVSYNNALEFCKKLSELQARKVAGRRYRLPTEAEWEYACRAGTSTPFHFGKELNGSLANCDGNSPWGIDEKGPFLGETVPVGRYPANPWGLHDMHGNVWEWCLDWYGDYDKSSNNDPQGAPGGKGRVLRGGCWYGSARSCRASLRLSLMPASQGNGCGFRLVLGL